MNEEIARPEPARAPARRGRRFKRHELELAGGGRLVLGVDGLIEQVDDEGTKTRSWAPDDPDWPNQAIRFGLHAQAPTLRPPGRNVQGTKPPHW